MPIALHARSPSATLKVTPAFAAVKLLLGGGRFVKEVHQKVAFHFCRVPMAHYSYWLGHGALGVWALRSGTPHPRSPLAPLKGDINETKSGITPSLQMLPTLLY